MIFLQARGIIRRRHLVLLAVSLVLSVGRVMDVTERQQHTVVYRDAAMALQRQQTEPALALLSSRALSAERQSMLAWITGMAAIHADQPQPASVAWQFLDKDAKVKLSSLLRDMIKRYEANQQLKETAQLLEAWVLLAPDDWRRYDFQGNFYVRHGQIETASAVFSGGADATSGAGSAYLAGRAAETVGNWSVASDWYERAMRRDDAHALVYFRQAVLLDRHFHDPAAAIAACEEAVHRAPGSYACYERLGLIHERLGDWESARGWYAAGFDHVSRGSYKSLLIRRLRELAAVYERAGDTTEAVATYRMILQRDPEDEAAIEAIGRLIRDS
ncbi:MAG: tetratricopeptide repeat protein [bacterium]